MRHACPFDICEAAFQIRLNNLQSWRIMEQQDVMFNSGMLSLALSLLLACLTLVVVTGNLVLAALASTCITAVVVVFLGAMQLLGWTLGAPCQLYLLLRASSTACNAMRENASLCYIRSA